MENRKKSSTQAAPAYRCLTVPYYCLSVRRIIQVCMLAIGVCLSTMATALEFQCNNDGDERVLRVEVPGQEHLCEVTVTHQQTGKRDVLWHARNDTMFCSARAYELRDKYENLWSYACTNVPEIDDIDQLSSAQRSILDQRLKKHIERGRLSEPAFEILSVRAVASTPLDKEAAKIAFQFLTDKGDFTEIVDDRIQSWDVIATINELDSYVTSNSQVQSAHLHSITDEGALKIRTQLSDANGAKCFGTQEFASVVKNASVEASSPHRFTCQQ